MIQCPVIVCLFACFLNFLSQNGTQLAVLLDANILHCWMQGKDAGAGLTAFMVQSTIVFLTAQKFLSWVLICLKFKGYQKLLLWHPTIILDPSPSSKCTRASKADRCPLCTSGLVKGALCILCLNCYVCLVSRGTCNPLCCHLAPKVPIHLSLIQVVCSFVEMDSCGSQLFCITSNQWHYCKRRYKKLPLYQTIRLQFSLVWEAGNKTSVPQELHIFIMQLLCELSYLSARGTMRQQPCGSNGQLRFEGKKDFQLCVCTAK